MTAEFHQLLEEFDTLPKIVKEPTYLELCRYPYNRFEEICSRLLCFYFSPSGDHGLGDLFLKSLMQILNFPDGITLNCNNIHVISEDNAEGKRVDILIYSDTFVIGIENKINASLYNPLDIYKSRIEKYAIGNRYFVVLSLREIQNTVEKAWMKQNGFINITYGKLFDVVNNQIATCDYGLDNKYILYLKDFVKTLNNMTGQNVLSKELSNFFHKNSSKIDELILRYNEFQSGIEDIQIQRINYIKNELEIENPQGWWIWNKYLLVNTLMSSNGIKIGLEGYYDAVKDDALGMFQVQIVAWSLNDWNFYEKKIMEQLFSHETKIEKTARKCSILLDTVWGDDEVLILSTLKKYFFILKRLTEES